MNVSYLASVSYIWSHEGFFFFKFLSITFYTVDLNLKMHYTLSSLRKKENGSCPRQEMWKRRVGKVNSDTGGREIQ